MKNFSILAGVLLVIGLVNAWVLNMGFNNLSHVVQFQQFSSSSKSPVVMALPGNRFIIVDDNQARIFRVNPAGKVTLESRAVAGEGYNFEALTPTSTPR